MGASVGNRAAGADGSSLSATAGRRAASDQHARAAGHADAARDRHARDQPHAAADPDLHAVDHARAADRDDYAHTVAHAADHGHRRSSLQTVNVRRGPGASFGAFEALFPGTEVQVIGVDESGRWLNVKLEDGREGWINTPLVRIDPTATPLATFTLPPDQTAAAGGTPLPTALIGGGAVTATPALDLPDMPPTSTLEGQAGTPNLPIIDFDPINATSTALAAVLGTSEPSATPGGPTPEPGAPTETHAPIPTNSGPIAAPTTSGEPEVQTGVDLYVNCDNPPRGLLRAPSNLAAGSTAEISLVLVRPHRGADPAAHEHGAVHHQHQRAGNP
ncbi:MAG: SH3 domain-containing protein [Chloroflexi bacterium]|nr:SH3 domain-containing protein [Chloroflexota bacterium]